MTQYKIPCGRTTGHGTICDAAVMCGGCTEISRLRVLAAEMIKPDPKPTLSKKSIETFLGPAFRRMSIAERDAFIPKIEIAREQLRRSLTGNPVFVVAASPSMARNFEMKMGRKIRYIHDFNQLRGLNRIEIVILNSSLPLSAEYWTKVCEAYTRDSIIWQLHEW